MESMTQGQAFLCGSVLGAVVLFVGYVGTYAIRGIAQDVREKLTLWREIRLMERGVVE